MEKLELTGEQFTEAMELLKAQGISGNEFCRKCNATGGSQTYWRTAGIGGAAAKILHGMIGAEAWNAIKGEDHAATGLPTA